MLRLAAISERALVPAPRSPQWALSFGNEGIALMLLAERRDAAHARLGLVLGGLFAISLILSAITI